MVIRCRWRFHEATQSLRVHYQIASLVGLFLLINVHGLAQASKTKQPPTAAAFRNTAPGVRYLGSKVCVGCHSQIYQQFSRTDMAHSTFLPGKIVDLGWLNKPVDIFNEKHNRHYQIYSRDFRIYQSEYGLDEQGKEVFRHTQELAYMVGSGVNGDTPVVRRGNYLFEAPLSYYSATKAWGLSPNYDVRDMGFGLPITADCMGCHTGRTQPLSDRAGLYKDPPVTELSIGCENCHGPGELHANERLAGMPVRGTIDRSIVNPAKLPSWLADNICMNCHEGDIRALQPDKLDSDFRPGTPLNDTVVIVKAPIDVRDQQSPLLEHYYSMTLSKCYRATGGKLGCQSCHNPHVQPSKEEAPQYFRSRCLACHTEKSCSVDLQTRLAQTPADACSNCHMPKRPALTVSHSALTDHRVTRTADEPFPEIALKPSMPGTGFIHVDAVPGKPDSVPPVALLKAYRKELIRGHLEFKDYYFSLLDRLSKSGSTDPFVLSAMAQKVGSDGDLPKAVRFARQVIEQPSASDSDYLLLDGFLARSGNLAASIDLLKQAISVTPYSSALYESLAARQVSAGNAGDAVATIKHGLELFPEDAALRGMSQQASSDGLVREGIARFKQGNLQSAMEAFQAAARANPDSAVAHDYIGVILGESGKLTEAIAEFDQAVRLDPNLPDPHFHLGLAYKQTGRVNDAIFEYSEALRLNPNFVQARYGLSAICAKMGDLDGAIRLLRDVVRAEPGFGEAHYNLGLNLWNRYKLSTGLKQKSDIDGALEELETASHLAAKQPTVFFALGQILADRGDLVPAVENLRKAVDLDSSNPEYHYNLGLALRQKGDMELAGAEFREALKLNPNHALAHRSLGLVLREAGDLPGAAAELRLAVSELPDDPEGNQLLGTVLLKMNDLPSAIDSFRKAISLSPGLAEARATLALALRKSGQPEEAKKELEELQRIDTAKANQGRAMILVETAEGRMKKGEITPAITELQEAVTLSPEFTEAHYQLGVALGANPDSMTRAEAAFRRVLELNPNDASAYLQLGLLVQASGDKAQASSLFEKAAYLAPGLTEAHLQLGRMARDSRDWATAVREFEAVLAWSPDDAKTHYDLATALKANGQMKEAAHELEIAQRLNPALAAPR